MFKSLEILNTSQIKLIDSEFITYISINGDTRWSNILWMLDRECRARKLPVIKYIADILYGIKFKYDIDLILLYASLYSSNKNYHPFANANRGSYPHTKCIGRRIAFLIKRKCQK